MKLTHEQQNAIDARDGTILVSAAAGSGKTAVLVRRVIERLTYEKNPINPDRLLIVTFTKPAAGEMRERIDKALKEVISKNPTNPFYKRQKMLLANATICTMDSYCNKLVKENFQQLDISPDFTTMDDNTYKILKNETVREVLEELYNDNSEESKELLLLFTNGKNDNNLIESIQSIYDFASSAPYPKKWLNERFSAFFDNKEIEESVWGKYALYLLKKHYIYVNDKIQKIILDASDGSDKLYNAVLKDLTPAEATIKNALEIIDDENCWDTLYNLNAGLKLATFTRFKEDEKDELFYQIKGRRDALKDDFKHLNSILYTTKAEYLDDMIYLRKIMTAFKNCVIHYGELLTKYQKEKNQYYFSDILHMAIDLLLVADENGELQRTPLALEISTQYEEILIDEFQDTNEAQNALFKAISNNLNNLFMVGDVKQSIYKFRQAVPQIFMELKDDYPEYDRANPSYPAKISLDANFRSRKGIVDGVNFIFNYLMTKDLGEIDYENGDQLKYGSGDAYTETDNLDTEIHIVETEKNDESADTQEFKYIGELINNIIDSEMMVGKKDNLHKVSYKDICVLMRSANKKAPQMASVFEEMNIPVYYNKMRGFFDKEEIITVISLLRVIDNPVSDVPLLSVMLSPMFPFDETEISALRCKNKKCNLYTMLKNNYDKSENVKYFFDTVNYLRALSVTHSTDELIRRILEITSYDAVCGAMENGEQRVLNLKKLISYGNSYDANGGNGLSGFIRYVDKLRSYGFDLEEANSVSDNQDVVRIMTVHKSKGLEFPIVILADCSKKFNTTVRDKAVVDKGMGIGTLRYDSKCNKELVTQCFNSVKLKRFYEDMHEEMRVLYVALTRAEEKLFIVGNLQNPIEKIQKLYNKHYVGLENNSMSLLYCSSYLQWIILACMNHPAFKELPFHSEQMKLSQVKTDSKIKIVISSPEKQDEEIKKTVKPLNVNKETVKEITEKTTYVYPFDYLKNVSIKYTASNMNTELNTKYMTSENPAFMGEEKLSPSQRGTLMHRFMEKCDLQLAKEDVKSEISRLIENKVFTLNESKAINSKKVQEFFKSPMFSRIENCDKFLREQQFTLSVPLSFIDKIENIQSDEDVVVQGVIDGLIINGDSGEIIDYKTDRVKDEDELIEKYKSQMRIYKKAAKECFDLKNVTVTLYSFTLSKEISIK